MAPLLSKRTGQWQGLIKIRTFNILSTYDNQIGWFAMPVNASTLRSNIYRLLDNVLETGKPLYIERKGRRLVVIPDKPVSKLGRLVKRDCIKGDPQSLVHMDWSEEWHGDLP
jgi:hypothetical protein